VNYLKEGEAYMKKEKSLKVKFITTFTVICASVTFISAFSGFLLSLSTDTKKLDSLGIISGTDGPTAVFVAGQSSFYLLTAVFALPTILGVIYLAAIRYNNKHN